MDFSLPSAPVLAIVGLPLGFVLTALCFAIAKQPIVAGQAFVGGLALAAVAGAICGFWRSPE